MAPSNSLSKTETEQQRKKTKLRLRIVRENARNIVTNRQQHKKKTVLYETKRLNLVIGCDMPYFMSNMGLIAFRRLYYYNIFFIDEELVCFWVCARLDVRPLFGRKSKSRSDIARIATNSKSKKKNNNKWITFQSPISRLSKFHPITYKFRLVALLRCK